MKKYRLTGFSIGQADTLTDATERITTLNSLLIIMSFSTQEYQFEPGFVVLTVDWRFVVGRYFCRRRMSECCRPTGLRMGGASLQPEQRACSAPIIKTINVA